MFAVKWFLGLGKTPKTMMSVLIVPLVILLVILILERLLKLLWFLGDKLFNAIAHIFSRENRSAYIIVTISMLFLGGYLEYSQGFITHTIEKWEYIVEEWRYVIDYLDIFN